MRLFSLLGYAKLLNKRRKTAYKTYLYLNPSVKGKLGENQLYQCLKNINCCKKFLPNIILETDDEKSTEIDLIMLSEFGIFVYEMKNYDGSIYGKANDYEWKKYINGTEYKFYNPIKQNKYHIEILSSLLNINPNLFKSFIVFSDNANLKLFISKNKEYCVINLKDANRETSVLISNGKPLIDQNAVDDLYNQILNLNKNNFIEK